MAPRLLLLFCVLPAVAIGCGDEEDESAAPPQRSGTALVVRVDADGPRGPERPKSTTVRCAAGDASKACRAAARLTPANFGPPPDNVACTQIFGGPETARISGRLRGEPVSATLSKVDGCEISRWKTFAALLEQAG